MDGNNYTHTVTARLAFTAAQLESAIKLLKRTKKFFGVSLSRIERLNWEDKRG